MELRSPNIAHWSLAMRLFAAIGAAIIVWALLALVIG
jgi:F0F1-type ATP synthase membrane subunit a